IQVPSGGNLQGAIDSAQFGDTIVLQAGATYSGTFTLPAKSGTGWIVIRTSAPDSSLPPQGRRMTPSYASALPKIVTPGSAPAIRTATGAHHYRLVGLEITVGSNSINYGLVLLGDTSGAQTSLSQVPHSIVLDRVYIHGRPTADLLRGVAMNSASSAVIDSWISDVHFVGADSQAICGWNGPGPYKIVNNYLEAAGENVMFGGADPDISNLVPSDIEVRGNYMYKPLSWKIGHPTYAGRAWTVKNLFELKNARRVVVEGNVFENNWQHAQNGFSILFTVRNQSGGAPWSVVEDVSFNRNVVRHVAAGVNILGRDDNYSSQQTKRILIGNNVFEDVNASSWGGNGRFLQMLDGTADITVDHNTVFHTGEVIAAAGSAHARLTYRNNISPHNRYGIAGDNYYGNPAGALSAYFPGAVVTRNILQGGSASQYPAGNYFPSSMNEVGFVNYSGGDYRLASGSPYRSAGTDGKDLGADIVAVNAAAAAAINGTAGSGGSTPPPPPPPADTTAPTVAITTPSAGSTVASTVTVSASANDNVGVAGVRFFVDGTALGVEDTASPYQASWNTASTPNGSHTLTAVARDAAGNTTSSSPVTVTVSNTVATQSPYNGSAIPVPGAFEAENFDRGGQGLAYHDLTAGNQGGLYRTAEDVDIISPYAGGHVINNFQTGEWLEYTIHVPQSGTYALEALVSSMFTVSRFHIDVGGIDRTGRVDVPNTGSWSAFRWVGKSDVSLPAGQHVLRITADAEYFNLDALRISAVAPARTPFTGTPFAVPGQFEAEDYDRGGEGVTWHDRTSGNQGGLYRTDDDVDIISPYAGGHVVNNFQTGEWLEYTIRVTVSGTYSVEALVSSMFTSSRFHIDIDGVDRTGVIGVPNTGGWGVFRWIGGGAVTLSAGEHIVRITADAEYFNLDALRVTSSQLPWGSSALAVPGQIEAEDFDRGGEGIAYHDMLAGNQGGLYRTSEDVDIVSPYAGGHVVNNFQTGEWLEYTFDVPQAGTYTIEALISSAYTTTARFHFEVDGADVTGAIDAPNTGWWGAFQWVGRPGINLTAGRHVLRLHADAEYFNVDAIRIVP
ncbi:MAG TPA: carbohydrate-binding protein, partial [Thermoanaerobaculia bacterium]|nr:carbohydrate-binding protein [Thermoanaerobaculia bacterium]